MCAVADSLSVPKRTKMTDEGKHSKSRENGAALAIALLAFISGAELCAQPASPLTAAPASVAISWVKGTQAGAPVAVKITAVASTYFTVEPSSVPSWLTLSAQNGTAVFAGLTLNFNVDAAAAAVLGAGSYLATVHLQVAGDQDLLVPVSLGVSSPASTIVVTGGPLTGKTWSRGSPYPVYTLTVTSQGNPAVFTVMTTSTTPATPANWLKASIPSGIAYSWGTSFTVSFLQAALDNANVGDQLSGSVAIVSGGVTTTLNLTLTVTAPVAAITSIFPSSVPVPSGNVTVLVSGSGFFDSNGQNPGETTVTVQAQGAANPATLPGANIAVTGSNTMILTIPVADFTPGNNVNPPYSVTISASNPANQSAATTMLTVTNAPIINSVTDSAAFVEPAPGATPSVAPYEMVTLFGANFLGGASGVITATPDSTYFRYPTQLTQGQNNLGVTFTSGNNTPLSAYLLFATDNQINLLAPSGITGSTTVTVSFGGQSPLTGTATVNTVAAQPGIFTTASSGQGQGAILLADYSLNSSTNEATKSNTVLIYASGLGAPTSAATNTPSQSAATFPASCISTAAYLATINGLNPAPNPQWTSIDGAVIASAQLASNRFPPCFAGANAVGVTIGGRTATVTYAGWVSGAVGGLYQINAVVPTSAPSGTAIPVLVTVGSASSQPGVTMAIH